MANSRNSKVNDQSGQGDRLHADAKPIDNGCLLHSPHIVPMVSRAFEIIELLSSDGAPLSVQQIAVRTGTTASSVYRIIRTMVAYGYVNRIGVGKFTLCRATSCDDGPQKRSRTQTSQLGGIDIRNAKVVAAPHNREDKAREDRELHKP